MDKHIPIKSFDAVYLIDLCEPLLQVARKRFAAKGWSNVIVLCQDATQFTLPEWKNGKDPKGSVGFITMSYSLSMVRLRVEIRPNPTYDMDFRSLTIIPSWIASTMSSHLMTD